MPESYSLALSECLAAGVPVVAFDLRTIGERIRRHGGGVLVEPAAGTAGMAAAVAALATGGEILPFRSLPMSADTPTAFLKLYRELGLS